MAQRVIAMPLQDQNLVFNRLRSHGLPFDAL